MRGNRALIECPFPACQGVGVGYSRTNLWGHVKSKAATHGLSPGMPKISEAWLRENDMEQCPTCGRLFKQVRHHHCHHAPPPAGAPINQAGTATGAAANAFLAGPGLLPPGPQGLQLALTNGATAGAVAAATAAATATAAAAAAAASADEPACQTQWEFLDTVDLAGLYLKYGQVFTFTTIPADCVGPLALIWKMIFAEINSEDDVVRQERGWKLYLLHGALILANRTSGSGRNATSRAIKNRLKQFRDGKWEDLFEGYTKWQDSRKSGGPRGPPNNLHDLCADLIKRGLISKAMMRLLSAGMAPETAETLEALRKLHPAAAAALDPADWAVPDDFLRLIVDPEVLLKSIAAMKHAKAPGFSGVRAEFFQKMLIQQLPTVDMVPGVCQAVEQVINNEVPPVARSLLLLSKLIALAKPGSGIRPITLMETFLKVCERHLSTTEQDTLKQVYEPYQLSMGAPGGLEIAYHTVETLLQENPSWAVISGDRANAFNSFNRGEMARCVRDKVPNFMPYLNFAYSGSSDLIYGAEAVKSEEGSRQGGPLSGHLYALTQHPSVMSTVQEFGVAMVVVADDTYVVGPPATIMAANLHYANDLLQRTGLETKREKTVMYAPSGVRPAPDEMPGYTDFVDLQADGAPAALDTCVVKFVDGLNVAGVPLGSPAFVQAFVERQISDAKTLKCSITSLMRSGYLQEACLLVRFSFTSRIIHLLRLLPRGNALHLAASSDQLLYQILDQIACAPLSDLTRLEATLPTRVGGFGFPAALPIVDAARVGSWALTAAPLAEAPHLAQIAEWSTLSDSTWATDLRESRQRLNDQIQSDEVPELDTFGREPQKAYQAKMAALLHDKGAEYREQQLTPFQVARVNSLKAPGALSWISAIPSKPSLQMSAPEYRSALCYNMGIDQPCLRDVPKCSKGHAVDATGHHFLNKGCGTGIDGGNSGLYHRHAQVVQAFTGVLKDSGAARIKLEPPGLPGLEVGRRGDILTHSHPQPEVHTVFDVSISSMVTANLELRGPVNMGVGHVAETAAQQKRDSYELLEPPFQFVPLVYESYGRACMETQGFVVKSAALAAKRVLGFDSTEDSPGFIKLKNGFLGRWSKDISVAVQRSNARMIIYGRVAAKGLGPAGYLEEEYLDEMQEVF